MAATLRSEFQIQHDRTKISELYLQGLTQYEIAKRMKMTQPMVSYDLKKVKAEWLKNRLHNMDELIAKEVAKADLREREAWKAWKRSCKKRKTKATTIRTKGETGDGIKGGTDEMERVEDMVGDPRFLDAMERAAQTRRELLGMDAPKRTEAKMSHDVKYEIISALPRPVSEPLPLEKPNAQD